MEKELKKELKSKLKQAKKKVRSHLDQFADEDETIADNFRARFPDYGRDESDEAQEYSEYEERLSLEHRLEIDLKKINKALKKLKEGEYGLCEQCGKEINSERLRVYPEAQLCRDCVDDSN